MQSVAPRERVILLDVLRGFALFGILMVNIQQMFRPQAGIQLTAASSSADRFTRFAVDLLFEGKFFPIYSFLFGLGAYILIRRVEQAGGDVKRFFTRRLNVLAAMGAAHGILLWSGEVLFSYAVMGHFLIRRFRDKAPGSLLTWSFALLATVPVLMGFLSATFSGESAAAASAAEVAEEIRLHGHGTFAEVTLYRLREFGEHLLALLVFGPTILGLFLLGLQTGLTGRLFDRPAMRRQLLWTLPTGLALCVTYAAFGFTAHYEPAEILSARGYLRFSANWIGGIILSQAYVAIVALVWPRLVALAPAGRLALTNYLAQSLILSTVAYGYGFGQYNKLGQAALAAIAIALYAAQLAFSHWWLRHHDQGPMEMFWRRFSYSASN